MTDPKRIPTVIEALARAWMKHPDLRLAQLVIVAADAAEEDGPVKDPFFCEDDKLLEGLKRLQ